MEQAQKAATIATQAFREKDISDDAMHYIRENWRLTDEDEKNYRQRFEIDEDSDHVHYSTDVQHSNFVTRSMNVHLSQYIYDSQVVSLSSRVYKSNHIIGSGQIFESFNINNSSLIMESSDITNCSNVIKGKNINNSMFIHSSKNVTFSQYAYKSESIEGCMMSGFLTNCTDCLLCFNIQDAKNMVFNQEVSAADIARLKDILHEILEAQNISMICVTHQLDHPFHYSMNFKTVFEGLNQDFYEILKRFPHYEQYLARTLLD